MYIYTRIAKIDSGEAVTGAIHLDHKHAVGIIADTNIHGSVFTFRASIDNGNTFYDMYDQMGEEIKSVIVPGAMTLLKPQLFAGVTHIILRSGTKDAPVLQVQDINVTLIIRNYF